MWVIVSLDLSGEPGMRRVLAQGAASFTWKIPSHLKVISTLKVMFFSCSVRSLQPTDLLL